MFKLRCFASLLLFFISGRETSCSQCIGEETARSYQRYVFAIEGRGAKLKWGQSFDEGTTFKNQNEKKSDLFRCIFCFQASRAQILKRASDYIQLMRKRNSGSQKELDELNQQIIRTKKQSKIFNFLPSVSSCSIFMNAGLYFVNVRIFYFSCEAGNVTSDK